MSPFHYASQDDFDTTVLKSDLPVILEFGAPWCVPCKRMEPVLEQAREMLDGRVSLVKVDVDENPDLVVRYEILSVPTILLISGGKEHARLFGLQSLNKVMEKFSDLI